MDIKEQNRIKIKKLIYEKCNINDMFLVSIVILNKLNEYDTFKAYFDSRYYAEKYLSLVTNNGEYPYYAFCCDRNYWNKVDELLNKKIN